MSEAKNMAAVCVDAWLPAPNRLQHAAQSKTWRQHNTHTRPARVSWSRSRSLTRTVKSINQSVSQLPQAHQHRHAGPAVQATHVFHYRTGPIESKMRGRQAPLILSKGRPPKVSSYFWTFSILLVALDASLTRYQFLVNVLSSRPPCPVLGYQGKPADARATTVSAASRCQGELSSLMGCWSSNGYDDKPCQQQIRQFFVCVTAQAKVRSTPRSHDLYSIFNQVIKIQMCALWECVDHGRSKGTNNSGCEGSTPAKVRAFQHYVLGVPVVKMRKVN